MRLIVSIAVGLLFGLAVAGINTVALVRALRSGGSGALTGAVALRMLLDLLALGAVYLVRNALPLQFEPTLIATAVGLSFGTVALAIQTTRRKNRERTAGKEGE